MNAIRSFYDTFRVFPYMMTIEILSDRRQTAATALFCATCGSALYAATDSPVISVFVVLFLPEFLFRVALVLMTLPH
jgi:hypothetical protein